MAIQKTATTPDFRSAPRAMQTGPCRKAARQPLARYAPLVLAALAVLPAPDAPAAAGHERDKPGDTSALMDLAKRHEYGVGAPQDMDRAIRLYCDAAALGDPQAHYHLGWIYATGRTGKVDEHLAAAWFQQAAARQHPWAQQKLAALGADGVDLQQGPDCVLRDAMVSRRIERTGTAVAGSNQGAPGIQVRELGTEDIRALVRSLAPHYNLDPNLVLAVISVESNFDPEAVSPKNAQGLMQLIPETATRFGVENVWDPLDNMRGGMAYLRWLLDYFDGNVTLALAGYNAGEKAVEQHGGIPPYPETQNYVRKITKMLGTGSDKSSPATSIRAEGQQIGGDAPSAPVATLADRS